MNNKIKNKINNKMKNKMNNNWKRLWNGLLSPFAIGIYLTLMITSITFPYYGLNKRRLHGESSLGVAGLLSMAHQKSIDYRLRMRGPRSVSPNLAMLTIDDRAVTTIGRWPWPRATLARALEKTLDDGAKLLAFDISFAEPSRNPAEQVLETLHADGKTELDQTLTTLAPKLDMDGALAQVFTKYSSRIVAGVFYESTIPESALLPPESDFCRDMIYKRTPAAKIWDNEEVLLSAIDPYQPYMPSALNEIFSAALDAREKSVREELGTPTNRNETVLQDERVKEELHLACSTMLVDYHDEISAAWDSEILPKENPADFKFKTYDAWLKAYRENSRSNSVPYTDSWATNTPKISKGTKHTGFFNAALDADGTIRSKILLVRSGNQYYPSIALKAFLVANNDNASPKLIWNPATSQKEVGDLEITSNDTGEKVFDLPVDGQGHQLLNYAGPQKMYPYLSFADVLSDSPNADIEQRLWDPASKRWQVQHRTVKKADFIKDKIFIVGATATGIYDLRVTPFEENFPGAETHLNAIDNMIQRHFFRTPPNEAVYMPLILIGLGVALSFCLAFLGALSGIALTGLVLVGTALIDQHYFFNRGLVISVIWPLFLTSVIYVAMTFYRYLTEERGKKQLRQTFSKYVSPAIVNEILAHPDNIELGGKKVDLTIFFSDVRGFTTISEKLDPRALSDLLNSYLTPMTELVFKNRGTLDKYMGDAIMAFFGAPIAYKDHAKHACRCALQSLEKLSELQKEYAAKGLPSIDIGIGLNTGEVSVGNMGSETVRSYTVMGDAVNLASRLEGINKTYGTRIILSEMTYTLVKDSFICREVDWVRVKGKLLPVKIFELISEMTSERTSQNQSPLQATLDHFQQGYDHYHAKAWQAGLECFNKALDLTPTDPVSKLYVQRCQDYLAEPPTDDWDGVFVMKTK